MTLPDDVAVRTSNHHGSVLRLLDELSSAWVHAIGENQDALFEVMLDASDDFQAALFNNLCGYYRLSLAALRNALEGITIGSYAQACRRTKEFRQWRKGKCKMSFASACDGLIGCAATAPLRSYLETNFGTRLFAQRTPLLKGGVARQLFDQLSEFTHGRPGRTHSDLWQSNGPIYAPDAFEFAARMYVETMALCYVLIRIARKRFIVPRRASFLFQPQQQWVHKSVAAAYEFLGQ